MPKLLSISNKVQEQVYGDLMKGTMRRFGDAIEVFADYILTDLPAKKRKSHEELALDYHRGEEAAEHRRRLAAAAIRAIPQPRRIFPAPQIAGPVFRDSEFEPEGTPIWVMWKELLSRACDTERAGEVHPAFLKILNELSPDEAAIINYMTSEGFLQKVASEPSGTVFDLSPDDLDVQTPDVLTFYSEHMQALGVLMSFTFMPVGLNQSLTGDVQIGGVWFPPATVLGLKFAQAVREGAEQE